ncbi:hypothetical protein FT641_18490 [Bacillus paranthracis]|uniref:hypothetical protein n=1 Tax=Bacillus paranthracis TaxID=2026186 RepID=UPI00187AE68F|nr:hypothetical protein [Bacillus paranthracis]MBE7114447.1 hypothetical protein [Bacillus paranthracis]MBE7154679.1 hypothetical protein [Bacillus paranthracis]
MEFKKERIVSKKEAEAQLRHTILEDGEVTKNATFSLSDVDTKRIEDISKQNKLLEERHGLKGLPITKADIIANAIEVYVKGYFESLHKLGLEFDGENTVECRKDSPLLELDTLVVPTRQETFARTFIKNREIGVRPSDWRLDTVENVAIYVDTPVEKITHYAAVESISELSRGIYAIKVSEPVALDNPIELAVGDNVGIRRVTYTTVEKLKNAKYIHELSR